MAQDQQFISASIILKIKLTKQCEALVITRASNRLSNDMSTRSILRYGAFLTWPSFEWLSMDVLALGLASAAQVPLHRFVSNNFEAVRR